ncbi:ubiquitin domain-containing protein DSK2 [Aphelenchoides avenae]|nr:ubiquitin domain-containing protein DSK2 [Aphelenchus avenae]
MVRVALPNGDIQQMPETQTVQDVLENVKIANSELFLHGKKLPRTAKLSEIAGLGKSHTLRVLARGEPLTPTTTIQKAQLSSQLESLKLNHDMISEIEERRLIDHMGGKDFLKKIVDEFPVLRNDPGALDAISDYSLLNALLHSSKEFMEEHPDLLEVFKKVLERNTLGQGPSQPVIPRLPPLAPRVPGAAGAPAITPEMLQQALAAAFNPNANVPAAPAVQPPPQPVTPNYDELRQRFAAELTTLHEFGFTDDEENLRALQACEGNVERALELVISMREEMHM